MTNTIVTTVTNVETRDVIKEVPKEVEKIVKVPADIPSEYIQSKLLRDKKMFNASVLKQDRCRPTRAWDLGERVELPKESVFQLRNEFKNFAVSSVI